MSPIKAAITTATRAIGSFHPASMPPFARAHYRREAVAWLLISAMMGMVWGGVAGVLVKIAFAGTVNERWLNFAVALVTGAAAYAHLTSFLWATLSHGRHKIRLITTLQASAAVFVLVAALAPTDHWWGLIVFSAGAILTQVCWSGVITLRTIVWRANYARNARAKVAGKIATFQSITMALAGAIIGWAMSLDEAAFHYLLPLGALLGLVGASLYSRMRVRGHRALRTAEREHVGTGPTGSLRQMWRIVFEDRRFRQYLILMMILGFGNHMANAPLVIALRELFDYGYLSSIMLTASIPIIMMPVSIPFWARVLDRTHIVHFRARHSWLFVATLAVLTVGVVARVPALLWTAAVLRGFAFGGGVLGWNLGHHDFASAERSSSYMGLHVTLTGLRGLIAPIVAVSLYELFNQLHDGAGGWVFAICLVAVTIGSLGFVLLSRSMLGEEHAESGEKPHPPATGGPQIGS